MTAPVLSVISAVYNKVDHLPGMLDSLRKQTDFGGEMEFVFADDASIDGSVEWLEREAARDTRIRVLRNERNAGPAIRFNQAAAAARGAWFLPVDPDDGLSVNAMAVFLRVAHRHQADLVFARSQRGGEPRDLPADPRVVVSTDPLLLAATRKIVRMGYLVAATTWRAAGGADERVFIQDQSLPLRLGAAAQRVAYLEHVAYWLSPQDETSLSRHTAQQHHDRFFSMAHMLERDLPDPARRAIERQMISAWWKMHRDSGGGLLDALPAYLGSRMLGRGLSAPNRMRAQDAFSSLPGIRRPEPDR